MASASNSILFSGIQPTGGGVMLGNYIGALKNWVNLQDKHDCLFCVVDLHAITLRQDPAKLRELSYLTAAIYIAAGINPEKSLIFIQSQVPEHSELAWILSCNTWMGELSRMTQFKDKSTKGQNVGTGLFIYPSLMAADVLLYQASLVPVGNDQKQHLELMRDLAIRMNNTYGEGLFKVPEPYIPPLGARIMSLSEPDKKMSKSADDPAGTVFLTDSEAEVEKKFKRAVTDSLNQIRYSDEQPGLKNLITIQSVLTGKTPEEIVKEHEGAGYGKLKTRTAEVVIETWRPVRAEVTRLLSDKGELDRLLKRNAERASARAKPTLKKVREAMGFIVG